jgi:hypothetical protein
LKWRQEETIKVRSHFRHMHGHYIGHWYGQVLLRGTISIVFHVWFPTRGISQIAEK